MTTSGPGLPCGGITPRSEGGRGERRTLPWRTVPRPGLAAAGAGVGASLPGVVAREEDWCGVS